MNNNTNKKNFWNDWDLKGILTIVGILGAIISVVMSYTTLSVDVGHLKNDVTNSEKVITERQQLNKEILQAEIKILNTKLEAVQEDLTFFKTYLSSRTDFKRE